MNKFDKLVHEILNEGGFLKGIKTIASIPSAVKTAKEFMLGDDPAGMIKRGIEKLEQDKKTKPVGEDEPEEELNKQNIRVKRATSTGSKIENFDKDVIKALIASQGAVKQSSMQGQQAQQSQQGQQSPTTTAQQSALLKRDPKIGDTFSLVDKYGKQNRYKITKIDNGRISATSLLGTSAGI